MNHRLRMIVFEARDRRHSVGIAVVDEEGLICRYYPKRPGGPVDARVLRLCNDVSATVVGRVRRIGDACDVPTALGPQFADRAAPVSFTRGRRGTVVRSPDPAG